jgi:hypothetical protein
MERRRAVRAGERAGGGECGGGGGGRMEDG